MSELPSGWSQAALEQIITFSIGGLWGTSPNNPSAESTTVAVMRGADYRDWPSKRAANAAIRSVSTRVVDTRLLKQGDLVVEVSGGGPTQPVGRVVLIDDPALRSNELPLILSNFCRRIVLSHEVIPSYVYHQLVYKYIRGETERFQTATTNIRNLNFGKYITETVLDLAPRPEQERIVSAIEEQFSRLDAGVAALERVRQNLKRMRAAVLQAAVSGRLVNRDIAEGTGTDLLAMMVQRRGGKRPPVAQSADIAVPETWAVASLEAVTDPNRMICYGILMPKVRTGGTVPYVEVKDLRARRLDVAALHRTSAALHKEFSRSELNSGDVVLAIRGSYDRALVVPPEVAGANVSRDVARIGPLPGLAPAFVPPT